MSGAATGWAWKQPVPSASAKFVLVAMADQTTGGLVFMSVNTISQRTGLDRKTVMTSIAKLVDWGLLSDTGERRGRTGGVPVYRLPMNEDLFDNAPYQQSSTKSGTGTKTGTASEAVPVFPGSGNNFPGKRYQKRDTDTEALIQELDPSLLPRARAADQPDATAAEPATTSTGEACRAMRDAGMPLSRLNPSHPDLGRALAAGVTATELADVTREVVARGGAPPNIAYVCRTAIGRREESARLGDPANASQTDPGSHQPRRAATARPSAAQRVVENIMRRRAAEAAGAPDVGRTERENGDALRSRVDEPVQW